MKLEVGQAINQLSKVVTDPEEAIDTILQLLLELKKKFEDPA